MFETNELQAILPSDEDVQLYRQRGYHVTGKVLSDESIDRAVQAAERHFAGERDTHLPITDGFADWRPGDSETLRNSEFVALQNHAIQALVTEPVIGAIAARLTGSETIRLWDDQLVWKAPTRDETGPVIGWHTDRAYWMTCTSDDMLTAWIPFHDCPEEMGPVIYVEGSHRWPDTESMRTFNAQDLEGLERRFLPAAGDQKRVMSLKKGQMSFHHSRMVHGSDSNRGSSPRLSLALHMQDGSNRWRQFLDDQGEPWVLTNDRLARRTADGTPDYTDPDIFPVLWPPSQDRHGTPP